MYVRGKIEAVFSGLHTGKRSVGRESSVSFGSCSQVAPFNPPRPGPPPPLPLPAIMLVVEESENHRSASWREWR
jgi:hypothetical protein